MRTFIQGARRAATALLLSAAALTAPASAQNGEPVRIGAIFSTTGNFAGAGSEALAGVEILVEEVNAAGGIDGRPIELFHVDDESRPELAVSQVKRLIQRDKVVAVAGPASTVLSASMSPVLNDNMVPAVGCICFVGPITSYEFSTFPLAGIMGALGGFANEKGAKKIGVITQAGSLAELVENTQLPLLREQGFEIVGVEHFQANDTDVTPLLARLQSQGAELIFGAASGAPAALLAKNFKQIDYPGTFWTYGGNATAAFLDLVGDAGDVVNMGGYKILVYRDLPDSDPMKERLTAFAEAYAKKTGKEPGLYATFGYDTALSIVEAIRVAGDDPEKVRDALENQTGVSGLNGPISRSADDHNGLNTDWVAVRVDPVNKRYTTAQ